MLEGLSQHCDIDAFVESDPDDASAPSGVSVEHIARFETRERVRAGYDTVVFCLGNSEFHAEALSLLRKRRSGVVLAHDIRLTGLYAWTAAFRPELLPFGFLDSLRSMYGGRIPAEAGATGWLGWDETDRYGIYMAREVIGLADRYLVHSDYAAQVARLDAAPDDERKIERIKFLYPDPGVARRAQPDERTPMIVTLGVVAEVKQTAKVVEAFGHLASAHPEARLAVVGPAASEAEVARCREFAQRFGVENRVEILGDVDDDEFRSQLEGATLAVQLRAHSNGESQATIADCFAAGVPTIVTALGSARELPDEAVVKVEREISAEELGDRMAALLANSERRAAMIEAGLRHATERSFASADDYLYARLVLGSTPTLRAA
jgi:glycosyltransferase involved in cell wall biosynthesis